MALQMNRLTVKSALLAGLMFSLLCTLPSWAQDSEPHFPNPGNVSLSPAQQEQIGIKAANQVYRQMPVLPDSSPETQYVRKIGSRLVAVIPPEHTWPYEFHVLAEKDINAFALPGGQVFINLGTITAAGNEAELAGVMAHEMSHVYMQHSAKQMQHASLTQGLTGLAGAIFGSMGGALGALGETGVQMGANLFTLKYSRGDEAQADAVGAIILYRAGYNPMALANFFKKLEAQGGTPPQFLSDHPNPGNREEAIQNEIKNWPPENYRQSGSDFASIHRKALKVKAYTSQEIAQGAKSDQWASINRSNGAVFAPPSGMAVSAATGASSTPAASNTPSAPEASSAPQPASSGSAANAVSWSDIAPSSKFVFTDLGVAKMVRPQNWRVFAPQQQGQSVTIAPSAGVVGNGIGYGVVINAVTLTDSSGNIDQITSRIANSLESGGSGLRTVGGISTISVGSIRGRSISMESTSPFPDANGRAQRESDQLVVLPSPNGSVVYFVFVSPRNDLDRLRPTFDRMLQNVQF
jgi:hypothetical protein